MKRTIALCLTVLGVSSGALAQESTLEIARLLDGKTLDCHTFAFEERRDGERNGKLPMEFTVSFQFSQDNVNIHYLVPFNDQTQLTRDIALDLNHATEKRTRHRLTAKTPDDLWLSVGFDDDGRMERVQLEKIKAKGLIRHSVFQCIFPR